MVAATCSSGFSPGKLLSLSLSPAGLDSSATKRRLPPLLRQLHVVAGRRRRSPNIIQFSSQAPTGTHPLGCPRMRPRQKSKSISFLRALLSQRCDCDCDCGGGGGGGDHSAALDRIGSFSALTFHHLSAEGTTTTTCCSPARPQKLRLAGKKSKRAGIKYEKWIGAILYRFLCARCGFELESPNSAENWKLRTAHSAVNRSLVK